MLTGLVSSAKRSLELVFPSMSFDLISASRFQRRSMILLAWLWVAVHREPTNRKGIPISQANALSSATLHGSENLFLVCAWVLSSWLSLSEHECSLVNAKW